MRLAAKLWLICLAAGYCFSLGLAEAARPAQISTRTPPPTATQQYTNTPKPPPTARPPTVTPILPPPTATITPLPPAHVTSPTARPPVQPLPGLNTSPLGAPTRQAARTTPTPTPPATPAALATLAALALTATDAPSSTVVALPAGAIGVAGATLPALVTATPAIFDSQPLVTPVRPRATEAPLASGPLVVTPYLALWLGSASLVLALVLGAAVVILWRLRHP